MINLKTLFQLEQLDSSSVSKLKISFSRGQTLCVDICVFSTSIARLPLRPNSNWENQAENN